LVDGLLRSSGAAKIMGLSIDQTISLLTVMREASGRTGREVGNALNSILSYVQRPISIKTLEGLGIQVFADAAKTQFRNVMLIFQDIASNWDSLSEDIQDGFIKAADDAGLYSEELANAVGVQEEWNDLQQRDISQAAAGVYRRNYFIGMIERLAGAQEVLNGMTDAAGYSQSENARTMETLEKKYTSLKAAAQELAVALGDAGLLDALKGATDLAKNAADSFGDLDDNTKALVLTVLELLAAVTAIKSVGSLFGVNATLGAAMGSMPKLLGTATAVAPGWTKLIPLIIAAASAVGLYAYNSSKASAQSIEDSLKNVNAKQSEIDETNKLIQKYQELEGKTVQNNEVKNEMLDIQRQLAQIYPEYADGLDKEGNKLSTNIPLLRAINALKQQELELERQKIMMEAKTRLPQLKAEQKRLQERIDKNKQRLSSGDTTSTFTWRGQTTVTDLSEQIRKELISDLEKLQADTLEEEVLKSIMKNAFGSGDEDINDTLSRIKSGAYSAGSGNPSPTPEPTPDEPSGTYTNTALQDALRTLQHKKQMNEVSLQDEIAYLKNVRDLYVNTGEERMDIEERIYTAEKALKDKSLQDSINWINEKKALGELSAEQEIAAWNRVLTNQKNNIEAVKQATQNLYRLRKELREEEVQENKDSLKDLQDSIKDSYDERIDFIEKEKEAKVKAIEDELEQLDRDESEYDYDKKMADLEEQLAYWSVRTGEEARKNLADIREQIAEAEHERDVELQKQGLEDEKDAIEDAAEEEKEKWKTAYEEIEKAFSDSNINIVANAKANSQAAYDEWYNNFIVPLQKALSENNVEGFSIGSSKVGGSISELEGNAGSVKSQIYQAAKSIVDLKKQYEVNGDKTAAQMAMQYYDQLHTLDSSVADMLHSMNFQEASQYISDLPKFHTGGETLSAGWAQVKPGEFFFPPDLSKDLKTLIAVSSGITGKVSNNNSSTSYDNRKEINIDKLINIEKNYNEDETDMTIWARELNRAVLSLA
jgi:hypothetical protein